MSRQIEPISEGLLQLKDEGQQLLGVNTNISSNSFALRKLVGQKRQDGWRVDSGKTGGDQIVSWRPGGFLEHGGSMYVYGPYVSGRFFLDQMKEEAQDRLEAVRRVAEALATLAENDVVVPILHTLGILLLDDGGVLFLPPDIVEVMRGHQNLTERLDSYEHYNHPDKSAPETYGFFLAACAYEAVVGTVPFDGEDEEHVHARIRLGNVVAAQYRRIGVRPEISEQLHRTLSGSSYEESPAYWSRVTAGWLQTGLDGDISEEEREKIVEEAQAEEKRVTRIFQRKESMRRNGRRMVIIALAAAAVLSIPGTIIYNALQPRATAGFAPEEVVTAFYTGINALDHVLMEDAVVDKAGQGLIREVTNLFVIDRQRMAVEMVSGFVDAQLWRESDMPTLENGSAPYGVAYLTMNDLASPEDERWFEVTYERWSPNFDSEGSASAYLGTLMTDQVRLRLDRKDWVIYQIDEMDFEPLDLAQLRADLSR